MAWPLVAAAVISAGSAYYSSKKASKPKTTKSWIEPSAELGGYDTLRGYQANFDKYADFGFVEDLWNRYNKMAARGAGGKGVGGNWKGAAKWIADYLPKEDEYTKRTRAAEYLDIADDPYYRARIEGAQQDFKEEMRRGLGSAFSAFSGGGSMGMSGAHGMFRGRLTDDALENWSNTLATMDAQEVGARRAEAIAANQGYQQVRGNWQNAAAGVYASNQAQRASTYASGLAGMLAGIYAPSTIAGNYLYRGSRFMQDWGTHMNQSPGSGAGTWGHILSGASAGMGTYAAGKSGAGGGKKATMAPGTSPTGSPASYGGQMP